MPCMYPIFRMPWSSSACRLHEFPITAAIPPPAPCPCCNPLWQLVEIPLSPSSTDQERLPNPFPVSPVNQVPSPSALQPQQSLTRSGNRICAVACFSLRAEMFPHLGERADQDTWEEDPKKQSPRDNAPRPGPGHEQKAACPRRGVASLIKGRGSRRGSWRSWRGWVC